MMEKTVLIAEDDQSVREVLQRLLTAQGYRVLVAADGEEALAEVAAAAPDVVVTDAMMPRLDGFELTRLLRAREETRLIPVVMVTGLREVEDRVRALEAGVDDFLAKPVHPVELTARVRSLCKVKEYHDLQREYRRRLERAVRARTRRLREALSMVRAFSLDTVYRLSRTAEFRDNDTGEHIQRMSYYVAAVARKIGLPSLTVRQLRYASPLHDIGKVGIPDSILLKPGRLTEQEWEIMKEHTTIGARILAGSRSEIVQLAELIALTHHERWDGSGYPRGTAGQSIPLPGRITAVADVFDALSSTRAYKAALPLEKAFEAVQEGRGTHFDPLVADAFLAIPAEVRGIRARFEDGGKVGRRRPAPAGGQA